MSTSSTVQNFTTVDLRELSVEVVRKAMKGGATAAEVVLRDGSEFSTDGAHGRSRDAEGIGLALGGRARVLRDAVGEHMVERSISTGIDQMVKARAEPGEDHVGRSVRRDSGAGPTWCDQDRSRSLLRRCLFAFDRRPYRLCAASGESGDQRRSADLELRWRQLRCGYRREGAGELARVHRRLPALVLFGVGGADCAAGRLVDAARLLVLGGAFVGPAGSRRSRWARKPRDVRCGGWVRAR